jgi:flagellar biosynthesis chaperone FliJ
VKTSKTLAVLTDLKVIELNQLDVKRQEYIDSRQGLTEKIEFIDQIIEENSQSNSKNKVQRFDYSAQTKHAYFAQLFKIKNQLAQQLIDIDTRLGRLADSVREVRIEKQKLDMLHDKSKRRENQSAELAEQKQSDAAATQHYVNVLNV